MDKIDLIILKQLQKNATIPLTELSKKAGISTTPCWNRIRKMEEEGIITSKTLVFSYVFHPNALANNLKIL